MAGTDYDARHGYRTFITTTCLTLDQFRYLAATGSPFLLNVIDEGIVLHDEGCYARVRDEILAEGRRHAG